VGLSVHAPFRVATERTMFAMPETTIGFFPDVGASYFLPKLDGAIGTYLATTSDRLKGFDVYMAGIATHYVPSENLSELERRLGEVDYSVATDKADLMEMVNGLINEFSGSVPEGYVYELAVNRECIDRCFSHRKIEDVISALEKEGSEFANATLKSLLQRSPTSLKVALRQMNDSKNWSIKQTFMNEYKIASRFMAHPDFVAGVSARLIHKPPTTPEWTPSSFDNVSDSVIDEFFAFKGNTYELLSNSSYAGRSYPYDYGLPSERYVESVVKGLAKGSGTTACTRDEVLERIIERKAYKPGIEMRVWEILNRRTTVDKDGMTSWKD